MPVPKIFLAPNSKRHSRRTLPERPVLIDCRLVVVNEKTNTYVHIGIDTTDDNDIRYQVVRERRYVSFTGQEFYDEVLGGMRGAIRYGENRVSNESKAIVITNIGYNSLYLNFTGDDYNLSIQSRLYSLCRITLTKEDLFRVQSLRPAFYGIAEALRLSLPIFSRQSAALDAFLDGKNRKHDTVQGLYEYIRAIPMPDLDGLIDSTATYNYLVQLQAFASVNVAVRWYKRIIRSTSVTIQVRNDC